MRMAFEPYGQTHVIDVMNLHTKRVLALHVPTTSRAQIIFGVSWLPGSKRLLVQIGSPNRNAYSCPPGECRTFPPPPPPVAYVDNVSARVRWVRVPRPRGVHGGWTDLALEGAGGRPGTVLVLRTSASSSASAIDAEQVATGRILSNYPLPTNTNFLARDPSGSRFLISSPLQNATDSWAPSLHQLTRIGPLFSEASW
jgi:hypothetical protein